MSTSMNHLPTLGIDPGSRWTAGVLIVGAVPVYGWTLGPIGATGAPQPDALDRLDDLGAHARYLGSILDAVAETVERAEDAWGKCRVAVEGVRQPASYRGGRPSRIPARDWVTPRTIALGITAVYPDAVIVDPDALGKRPRAEYPAELRRRRPETWGPCMARKGERDHERSAYDVACLAAALPRAARVA